MSVNIWLPMMVDRVHISVGIGSKDLYSFAYAQLHSFKDHKTDFVPKGKIIVSHDNYLTRMSYYPSKGRKIAEIAVGSTKSKHRYFRLGLFPSQFAASEFEQFKDALSILLPDFCYAKLFQTGRVSYIELAQDSLTHPAHTFLPFRAKTNCSEIYIDNGIKGSTYLGSELSSPRFCIYDKAKQLAEKHLPVVAPLHTRIESRLRYTGLRPCELEAKMPNPFEKLEIADLTKARDASEDKTWQGFVDLCFVDGSATALAQFPKQRKQFMKMLRAVAVPWWNPQQVWLGLPQALEVIAP